MNIFKLTPFAEMMWNSSSIFPWPVFIPLDILYDLQAVGQILAEAVEPDCHSPYDAESGVSSTDEGEKPLTELETDTGAGKGASLSRKNLQKSSAKDNPHFCVAILVFSFFQLCSFQLINVIEGGGWEGFRRDWKLVTYINVIFLYMGASNEKNNFGL